MPHLLALTAAVVYATGALLIKRASDLGVGSLRTLVVSNLVCALMFQPLLLLGGTVHPQLWWQPAIVSLCFICGQWLTFFSLHRGDVSVATPVLGSKIVLVAVFVTLLTNQTLRPQIWAAALLATLGIAILNRRHGVAHHHVGQTIVAALLGAVAFALFDVLVQKWSPAWGLGRFLPITVGIAGVLSLVLIPRLPSIPADTARSARGWLLAAAVAIGVQSLLIVVTIAHWGQAAQANVIYSSRGLWSISLVWLCGHWFQIQERQLGVRILAWRFAGAALMMAAIVLVLV